MHYNISRHKVSTKISARALCPSAELGGRAAVLCSGMDFIADACSEHMSGRASRDKHRTRAEFCLWPDSAPGHSSLPSSVMLSERPLYARCCQTCSETCPYWSLCYLGLHTHTYICTLTSICTHRDAYSSPAHCRCLCMTMNNLTTVRGMWTATHRQPRNSYFSHGFHYSLC